MSDEVAPGEPLHPLLARRWSPTTFEESYEARTAEVGSLLEAARWAPSAGNSQPWAFISARRDDAVHQRLLRHLTASSARWAPIHPLPAAALDDGAQLGDRRVALMRVCRS